MMTINIIKMTVSHLHYRFEDVYQSQKKSTIDLFLDSLEYNLQEKIYNSSLCYSSCIFNLIEISLTTIQCGCHYGIALDPIKLFVPYLSTHTPHITRWPKGRTSRGLYH